MQYEIRGGSLPVVVCNLNPNESMITESGSMSWMSANMQMETSSNGGIGKAFGRMFSGESIFQNIFTARNGSGMIAFASSFPGSIMPIQIGNGNNEMIVQKTGFLAAEPGVTLSLHFQKKLGAGFFGGEGFIMQRLSGQGMAFIEIDGSATEYVLSPGEQMIVDTGYLAAMESTCTMNIRTVPGLKNKFLGGEGLFFTEITGPGKIILQSMPVLKVAGAIQPFLITNSN